MLLSHIILTTTCTLELMHNILVTEQDSDFDPITYQPLEVQTGNYTLWNLNFGAKLAEDLDLTLNARNIFDKEYQSVYGYATEGACKSYSF